MSTKRKTLSLAEKKKIFEDFEKSNVSKACFAKEHGIPRTTLNNILSSQAIVEINGKRKRKRLSPYEKIEEALLEWIKCARAQNVPISCLVLKEKALQIAAELGENDFMASNGWIQRFKLRHDLTFKTVCGEAADVVDSVLCDWKKSVLDDILKRYKQCDIFNVDECGLFFRVLPDKTLTFKKEKCVGGKKSKERLTILLGANMDGSEKLRPLVIGKFLKPRCFKNVKSLPLDYDANKKAWMNANIFEKTIRRFDRHFLKNKRKVVFIVDNCPAHITIPQLKSIELVMLPPNVTSVLQPMDQGVIQNLKMNYRKLLLKDLISAIDMKKNFHVSVLDAIFYIDKSWSMVTSTCISNCFRHAGFQFSTNSTSVDEIIDEEDEDDIPLAVLMQNLRNRGCAIEGENEYVRIDDEIPTTSQASISEIVSQVLDSNAVESDGEDNNSDAETEAVTQAEALRALNVVRHFFTNHEGAEEHFQKLQNLENIVQKIKPKSRQSSITDYFK